MRRQFAATYDEAIALLKEVKNSNDTLNRAIGIDSPLAISTRLRSEQPLIDQTTHKIEQLIQKLEQSYLDPDTARKIGTAKQQFRIQRDRRKQLLLSAHYDPHPSTPSHHTAKPPAPSLAPPLPRGDDPTGSSTWGRFHPKQSETTTRSENASIEMQRQDELGLEFQLERKILQERNNEINIVSKSLLNVHQIMNETSTMTYEQGEKLDIIGEELFETYRNVRDARENMAEANEHQRSARSKYVYLSVLLLLAVAVGAMFILF